MPGAIRRVAGAVVVLLVASGCSAATDPEPAAQPPTTSPSSESEAASPSEPPTGRNSSAEATPSPSPSPRASRTQRPAERPHPVSLPALFDKQYDGRGLRLGDVLFTTDAYTQRTVTYLSDGLRISGVMNVPRGEGPFPVLVLAHGYIDPAVYVTGQGLRREQDWLARAGYAVLHVDYRNHAGSDDDPSADRRLRLGYTVDVINAVHALRRAPQRWIDRDRIGLLGRSMGGGVVYNALAVAPGLVDAAVVFAPVSSLAEENFDRWIRNDPGRSGLAAGIIEAYGSPERNPEFWGEASPRTYFDRVREPLLIHHGTADESCPIRWSRQSLRALERAGVDARMFTYPGEPHAFITDWPLSMRRTEQFFADNLA